MNNDQLPANSNKDGDSHPRRQQAYNAATFCTPEKRRRYQTLWQQASAAANAELQAVKDGDPSAIVICPTEVLRFINPELDGHIGSDPDTPGWQPGPLSSIFNLTTLGVVVAAATPVVARYIWAYRKVARCSL
jgi:hypothetical protein